MDKRECLEGCTEDDLLYELRRRRQNILMHITDEEIKEELAKRSVDASTSPHLMGTIVGLRPPKRVEK